MCFTIALITLIITRVYFTIALIALIITRVYFTIALITLIITRRKSCWKRWGFKRRKAPGSERQRVLLTYNMP